MVEWLIPKVRPIFVNASPEALSSNPVGSFHRMPTFGEEDHAKDLDHNAAYDWYNRGIGPCDGYEAYAQAHDPGVC